LGQRIDQLGLDTPVLHWLDGIGDFDDPSRSLLEIGEGRGSTYFIRPCEGLIFSTCAGPAPARRCWRSDSVAEWNELEGRAFAGDHTRLEEEPQ
jgi:hypothetical protein